MSPIENGKKYVTVVPDSLKRLTRLIGRTFYSMEESLIIDTLVRFPCVKEDDIGDLLFFEKKQLRSRLNTLKNEKLIQLRLKMETGPEGKAQKINNYFINYRTFVNVVKYKLDLIRKRLESDERDANNRASFKCLNCYKTYTDLETDQLFNFHTQEFRCTFCGHLVEEQNMSLSEKDSRLMLARFNKQFGPLYDLLMQVESINLAPSIMEPEVVNLNALRGVAEPIILSGDAHEWSGETTRNQADTEESWVDVTFGDEDEADKLNNRKDRPVWMAKSTVTYNGAENVDDILTEVAHSALQSQSNIIPYPTVNGRKKEHEDIMSVLLLHEKRSDENYGEILTDLGFDDMDSEYEYDMSSDYDYDSSEIDDIISSELDGDISISSEEKHEIKEEEPADEPVHEPILELIHEPVHELIHELIHEPGPNEISDSDSYPITESDEEVIVKRDDNAPPLMMVVAGKEHDFKSISEHMINKMTLQEKQRYMRVYQDHISRSFN